MVALEFLTVSLELRHEVGAGVPIIANPWLMACSKPRDAGFEAGRHTPPRTTCRCCGGVGFFGGRIARAVDVLSQAAVFACLAT